MWEDAEDSENMFFHLLFDLTFWYLPLLRDRRGEEEAVAEEEY